jgi:NADH-quinone oxidoreductase subunit J
MNTFPAQTMILGGIFLVCVLTTVAGALLAVLSARIIRSVSGLALCCIGLAGLYYFLHSPLLALMEILIYVGAVCVTIVFAIMLAEPDEPAVEEKRGASMLWCGFAVLVCAAIFWGLWRLGSQMDWNAPVTRLNDGSIKAIGISLLTTYSLAFELISLALLVAILGALAIARTGRDKA